MVLPVIMAAAGESRKAMDSATSAASTQRPRGTVSATAAMRSALRLRWIMGVSVGPGHTAFTRMRWPESSKAMWRVKASTAPLDAV